MEGEARAFAGSSGSRGVGRVARVFLLSPARLGGKRAGMVLRPGASFDLARRLQDGGATLGEVMTFVSGLYFRGKVAYARAFAAPPPGAIGALVILPQGGLASIDQPVSRDELADQGARDIDAADPIYRDGLLAAARRLVGALGPGAEVVLLGSIATDRYCGPLIEALGDQLCFPAAFVGRGDNSRGGLMLRAAASGDELDYIPVAGATRTGPRPPRLPRLARPSQAAARRR
ncbi:MAG TPA: hypothetical protein VKB80_33375 [Kofleriaceae bacterium]|nr:hypothetical protein [Kofleriaceae bacterium]